MDKFKEMMRLFSDPYHYLRRVSLTEHLAKYFSKVNQRIQREAYIGGREVVNRIEDLLETLGIVIKRNRDY